MFVAEKKVIGNLTKCYSVAKINDKGNTRLLCAAEKQDACFMFDTEGNKVDTLWEGPGGVMTLEQFPGSDETIILATQKFYSPNDSAEAKIVYYMRGEDGSWKCNVLCDLPFVHRFGILSKGGNNYLIACTLKSGHDHKDDWSHPGKIFAAKLPEDITTYNEENQLNVTAIYEGLTRNHGFSKISDGDDVYAVVGAEDGVFKVTPPAEENGEWNIERILDEATSDMLYEDFDGDGKRELLTLSPFHGDKLCVSGAWTYPEELPFLHAIYTADIDGKKVAIIGNRDGKKELLAVYYDEEKKTYAVDILDSGAGPANVLYFSENGKHKLLAANRETDEIALYEVKNA